jgi:hypothetical protein
MTSYAGISYTGGFWLKLPGMSADIEDCAATFATCLTARESVSPPVKAPLVLHSPSAMIKRADTGVSAPHMGLEFFGDISVWPFSLNFGLVLSAKVFTIGIWNLTGRTQNLESWSTAGLDGVLVSNSDGYPAVYGVGGYKSYQVDVAASGQATIDGNIIFTFTGFAPYYVHAEGTRVIVFSFEPNWREPVVENLEWLTDVIESHAGIEQRLALRVSPRRSLKSLFLMEHAGKVSTFESYMWGWQQRVFAVPVWTDWTRPTADISVGASAIQVLTDLRDFAATRMAIIWRNYLSWEVVEVQSLTSSAITLTKPTLYAWNTMDRIIPVRLGRMSKTLNIPRPSASIAEVTVTFSLEIGSAVDSHRLGTSSLPQYLSLDVLTIPPHVGNDEQSDDYERGLEIVDYDIGAWSSLDRTGAPVVTRPYRWILKTRQEIMNFLAFLEAHRGQQVPFWMPTWSHDMDLQQDIAPSDVGILIKSINYTKMINVHANRRDLAFFPAVRTTTPIFKRITDCEEVVGGNEMITISSSFGVARLRSSFGGISFLTLCRFESDDFELVWHSDSLMEVTAHIREVLQ